MRLIDHQHVYLARRRPRLGLDPPNYRTLGWYLTGCAVITGLIWWGLA